MRKQTLKQIFAIFFLIIAILLTSCSKNSYKNESYKDTIKELTILLNNERTTPEAKAAIINKIALTYFSNKKFTELIVYLTEWVENNPKDKFNAYWLFMVAQAYTQTNADPMAEFYYERIIRNYSDLVVSGQSVHFACLENLIKISRNPDSRIKYFNQIISRFPSNVRLTEMYMRLAREYETIGEWKKALKTYKIFIEQPDSVSIQIADMPDAYNYAKTLIDFNNSPKDWTFKSLGELEKAIRDAIYRYQPKKLDTYRSRVNFFAVSWKQDENASTGQVDFSMANYMHGNRINCDKELIPGPTANEAYLKTTGWTTMPTWYFYFREVNFPADPDIHGTWEWAGIYIGDML